MLEWRLKAYRRWLTMESPDWAKLDIPPIDYQDSYYYAAPKAVKKLGRWTRWTQSFWRPTKAWYPAQRTKASC